jgi:hypothetical protein
MPAARAILYHVPMSSLQEPWADDARATLAAFAQVICALAPEVAGVSFHDVAAETLWLSEDFLLPEDHQLVGHALANSGDGSGGLHYGRNEPSGYSMAVAVRAALRVAELAGGGRGMAGADGDGARREALRALFAADPVAAQRVGHGALRSVAAAADRRE